VSAAFICLIAAKLINVWVPFLLKDSVDSLSKDKALLVVPVALIAGYALARVGAQLFGELRDFLFAKVSQFAQRSIALETFKHLHQLSLQFHLSRKTGGLSRVIERGTRGIQFVLNFMSFNVVPTIFELCFVCGILIIKFDIYFALVVLGTILSYVVLTLSITEWRLQFRKKMNSEETRANTNAIDSLLNFETVKYFTNEDHEFNRYDKSLARYEAAALQSQGSLSLLNVSQGTIIGIGLFLLMFMAANGVVKGTMTMGDYVLVNTFLIQLYLPLNFLGFVYREIKQSLIDMDKMFELLEIDSDIKDTPDAQDLKLNQAEIEFKNVEFSYAPDRKIIKGISFKVPAGKTTAIVGPSGSGKSTLARLLFRFYDVNSGSISIDHQDIRKITQKSLRRHIGVVPQDTVLFNDTIAYNIEYGKPGSTQAEIEKAAELAKIHSFVASLTDGYKTQVGERGLKLSGGEKQRVAIARSILKNPAIMVFDEATSALDSHTERSIQESLKLLSKNRSTIVIAHRLSTVVDADEILVLKEGVIVERGKHQELLSLKGEYFQMWEKQVEQK
jgi:ATP-binding cassette subfamily B protein